MRDVSVSRATSLCEASHKYAVYENLAVNFVTRVLGKLHVHQAVEPQGLDAGIEERFAHTGPLLGRAAAASRSSIQRRG